MQRRPNTNTTWQMLLRHLKKIFLTPMGKRWDGNPKGAPHGVALLLVLVSLALMSAIVVDMNSAEMVRYKLAVRERDALQAEALAQGGAQLSRLLLTGQSALQPLLNQLTAMGIPLPAQTVWQLIPLDSELLKGMTTGELQASFGLDVSKALAARAEAAKAAQEQAALDAQGQEEQIGGAPRFEPPEGGFGAFAGSFQVQIVDEEQKAATLRGWATATQQQRFSQAQRVYTLLQSPQYDFLFEERDAYGQQTDRYGLIANLYDWIDGNDDVTDGQATSTDWGRSGGGSEVALYTSYERIKPKNAYFDSVGELARVRGMTDAHLRAFGDAISIYGENKINILSAIPQSVEALVRICAESPTDPLLFNPTWMQETLQLWEQWKALGPLGGGGPVTPDGFVSFLGTRSLGVNANNCKGSMSTESRNFTVKSAATVGDVVRTVTMVVRVVGGTEETYFYSIE